MEENCSLCKDLVISSLVRASDPSLMTNSEFNRQYGIMVDVMNQRKILQIRELLSQKLPQYKTLIEEINGICHGENKTLGIGFSDGTSIKLSISCLCYGIVIYSPEKVPKRSLVFVRGAPNNPNINQTHPDYTERERTLFALGVAIIDSPLIFLIRSYIKLDMGIEEDKLEKKYWNFVSQYEKYSSLKPADWKIPVK